MPKAVADHLPAAARLPRTVKVLGLVSLLTDASSEMIYPLLPAFLTGTLHAGAAFVGTMEGLAEATASLLKLLSGWLADRLPRRKPLVVAGYALSSVARPLMAVAAGPGHVLAIRILDRIGKGVRGAPRDALLADVTGAGARGRAFGFHRAMDHLGAVVGPLLASAVLLARHDLRLVFGLAAVPALASVAVLAVGVQERRRDEAAAAPREARGSAPAGTPARLRLYLLVLAIFTLGNSSDAFLLLRAQEAGVSLPALPVLWTLHHVVKAGASTWAGGLSDRWGRRGPITAGWLLYAATYAGFAAARSAGQVWVLFAVYGLFYALTDGPERALVADLGAALRGRAFGLYHAVTGAMLLPASLLAGVLWQRASPATALLTGSALALLACAGLRLLVPETAPRR